MFGPEYALVGVTRQLAAIEDLLHEVPQALRPAVVRFAAQYAGFAAWLNQSLNVYDQKLPDPCGRRCASSTRIP
ncbi:hypothetical protein [Micromonospora sp. KC213]|uniref:hypothetical protein n=1 Tax=Micromonospora sp. KC213 TaxID=2530378 RepID=UPI00104BD314|nr:hypothetical protein [Micromonospora sp. KC213]TDC43783.1 hypothetical protein E1166_01925 [Micromonospora sp. KC213]